MAERKWETLREFEEIRFEYFEGIGKITINRPRYYNAFTPDTTREMSEALVLCRENPDINWGVLEFENGVVGVVHTSWLYPPQAHHLLQWNTGIQIMGDGGVLEVRSDSVQPEVAQPEVDQLAASNPPTEVSSTNVSSRPVDVVAESDAQRATFAQLRSGAPTELPTPNRTAPIVVAALVGLLGALLVVLRRRHRRQVDG